MNENEFDATAKKKRSLGCSIFAIGAAILIAIPLVIIVVVIIAAALAHK